MRVDITQGNSKAELMLMTDSAMKKQKSVSIKAPIQLRTVK